MIFPDYIYNSFISYIIGHLFNKNTNFEVFYDKELNNFKINEVVNLSLVSKKWFQIVSHNLDIVNYKNYDLLKHFIDLPQNNIKHNSNKFNNIISQIFKKKKKKNSNSTNNSGNNKLVGNNSKNCNNNNKLNCNNNCNIKNSDSSKFKLIQNSKLIRVYKYLNYYKDDINNNKDIDKIYIEAFGIGFKNRTVSLLLEEKEGLELGSNCEIDLLLSFDIEENGNELNKCIGNDEFKGINNQVKSIYLRKSYDEEPDIEIIKKILLIFKPKMLNYYRCGRSKLHSLFFESNILESLELSSYRDFVDPKEISKLDNSSTKLKSVSISCLFNSITRLINDCEAVNDSNLYELYCDYYKNQQLNGIGYGNIEFDFKLMFERLSNNNTIRDLVLIEPCNNGFSICRSSCIKYKSVDTSFICNGLASIFSSPVTRIENLALVGIDYDNPILYSSLSNNKTISTLYLHSIENVLPFFKNVITNNSVIRNVIIEQPLILDDVKQLLLTPGLDLYSLTIVFCQNENVINLLNALVNDPSLSNININEITIYNSNNRSNNKSSRNILNNSYSTIINIIYINNFTTLSTSFK